MLRRRLFVALYAASGAAALVYEVTWTRLLTLQLGHTVAAASTVLAAFMGGLALGAWFGGARSALTLRAYAILELIVAASALALPLALSAIAAGFFLIPGVGLRATTSAGMALNVVAAGGAWWLATTNAEHAEPADTADSRRRSAKAAKVHSKKTASRALRASRSNVVVSSPSPAPLLAYAA